MISLTPTNKQPSNPHLNEACVRDAVGRAGALLGTALGPRLACACCVAGASEAAGSLLTPAFCALPFTPPAAGVARAAPTPLAGVTRALLTLLVTPPLPMDVVKRGRRAMPSALAAEAGAAWRGFARARDAAVGLVAALPVVGTGLCVLAGAAAGAGVGAAVVAAAAAVDLAVRVMRALAMAERRELLVVVALLLLFEGAAACGSE